MNQLDVYYRALLDYRQQTVADHNCSALRTAIASTNIEQDKITITRSICTIDREWVDAIEKGLVHVEKALKEERQFIQSNGEVVPIEKVRHVSKESVSHLAKHSNLITRYEEDKDLIPEKLYMVERLSDYTVYENKFLYMLLCYLRDFITVRYNDILDLSNRYEADFTTDKTVSTGKRRLSYSVSMHDLRRDDPYLQKINPAKDMIDRIHLLLKTVISFLGFPLMQEVAKVSMLKPPITKTNVLKMNNNFKGAVALYEFIMAYDKKGYEVEKKVITFGPFEENLADELAEAGGMVSFLVYEYGLAINKELKQEYLREEERRKVERIKARAERIETLKRRLQNSEISAEEYSVTLEDQLRDLEGEADRAESLEGELAVEREKTQQLTKLSKSLQETVDQLHTDIEDLKHQHFEEIERMKQEHEDAMHDLILKHEAEMQACLAQHENEIRALKEKHADELQREKDAAAEAERRHAEILDETRRMTAERIEHIKSECDASIREAQGKLSDCSNELQQTQTAYAALAEESLLDKARIKALGGITEDYTDREHFNALEQEYDAFTRLYKQQWKKTKQEIKKQHLNINNLKVQKEKKTVEEENNHSDAD